MLKEQNDYRQYLRNVLEERTSKNAHYSLRAFARDLELSPQMLSFVLNKKRDLSPGSAAEVAERLELNPAEAAHFVDLVSLRSRVPALHRLAKFRLQERASSA